MGRKTVAKIKQNLFWAFVYNVALIPIAAGALVPVLGPEMYSFLPFLAACAMTMSSVTVVSNSLLLTRYKPNIEASSNKVSQKTLVTKPKLVHEMIETGLGYQQSSKDKKILENITSSAKDPVCWMTINEKEAQFISEYEGINFYFCSAGCKRSFDKVPHKYTNK